MFGHRMNEFLPNTETNILMQPGSPWREKMVARETKLKKRRESDHDRWMEKTRRPPPLSAGDRVAEQSMHSNNPKKWERVGTVMSTEDYDKYGQVVNTHPLEIF